MEKKEIVKVIGEYIEKGCNGECSKCALYNDLEVGDGETYENQICVYLDNILEVLKNAR